MNSAISDRVARANHVITGSRQRSWIERVTERLGRLESIWIRKKGRGVMKSDEGVFNLSHIYDPPITSTQNGNKSSNTSSMSDYVISRQSGGSSQQHQLWERFTFETVNKNKL